MNILKKIFNWIVSIPQDKLLHDYSAALICGFSFAALFHFCPVWLCFILADVIATIALLLKEAYDSKHEGHSVELADILWGEFGVFKMNIIFLIMLL